MSEEFFTQGEDLESAISSESDPNDAAYKQASTDVLPQTTESGGQAGSLNEQGGVYEENEQPFLTVKYNHKDKALTQSEAVALAQKGLKYESSYKALQRLADLKGVSVDEFLNSIEKDHEESYRNSLLEKYGEDEELIGNMMKLYEFNKKEALENAALKREQEKALDYEQTNLRIAKEFLELRKEFPELKSFSALPLSVKQEAINSGMPLMLAYLLHQHTENKKIADAQKQELNAAQKSSGSMSDESMDDITQSDLRYLKALWSK